MVIVLAAFTVGATLASGASAAAWKFNGKTLEGSETVVGNATLSMTIPSLTTTCESSLQMTIRNSGGTGGAEVTQLASVNCSTGSKLCVVEAIESEKLPWAAKVVTKPSKNYVVLEGVKVTILYGPEECPLYGLPIPTTGTAGGLFDNSTSSLIFNSANFSATGTELKALGTPVEWNGSFPLKATGFHSGQTLTLS